MKSHGLFKFFLFLLIALNALFLSSCSHLSKQDGAPNYYIDETKIPNAVPKNEPLAKHGNMPSYVVFGKRYYTMKTCKNYEATGIASWYGTKFHAKKTSSGEAYSLAGMTAAHKTLPLPTYVEVTNLKNKRTIIVKVNDRGPFESNRLIDLSYVAAKKLGMLGHGTAQVRIKAITPNELNHSLFAEKKFNAFNIANINNHLLTRNTHNASAGAIYLQVGAFRNKKYAENLQQRLVNTLNVPVHISSAHTNSLYQVQVGPIKDRLTSNQVSAKLKRLGISCNKMSH